MSRPPVLIPHLVDDIGHPHSDQMKVTDGSGIPHSVSCHGYHHRRSEGLRQALERDAGVELIADGELMSRL